MPSHSSSRLRSSATTSTSDSATSSHSTVTGTSLADTSTAASDYGVYSDAADDSSELSSSSDEPSSESSSEDGDEDVEMREHTSPDGTVNLLANRGKKPTMKLDQDDLGPDIRTFLKDFLPQLKASNDELERQKRDGTLTGLEMKDGDGGEEKEHIEMDLGLGVLEAKDPNKCGLESESEDGDDESEGKEKDLLGKLMGRKKNDAQPVVQELDGTRKP